MRGFDALAAVDRRGLQGPSSNHSTSRRQSQGCVRREDKKRGRIHPLIHFMDGQGRPWQGVGVNAVRGIGSGNAECAVPLKSIKVAG